MTTRTGFICKTRTDILKELSSVQNGTRVLRVGPFVLHTVSLSIYILDLVPKGAQMGGQIFDCQ